MAPLAHERPEPLPDSREESRRKEHARKRAEHWNAVARAIGRRRTGRYYHRRLAELYRHLVAPGLRVLELGSSEGDLFAALEPAVGVGIDFWGRLHSSPSRWSGRAAGTRARA